MLSKDAEAVQILVREAALTNQPVFMQYLSGRLQHLGVAAAAATRALTEVFYLHPNEALLEKICEEIMLLKSPVLQQSLSFYDDIRADEGDANTALILLHQLEVVIYMNAFYEDGVDYLRAVDTATRSFLQQLAQQLLAGAEPLYALADADGCPDTQAVVDGIIVDLEEYLAKRARFSSWEHDRSHGS